MPLDAQFDHVAIAVPSWEAGESRWREQVGAGVATFGQAPTFWSRQLTFTNGARLELLAPPPDAAPDNFVRRFLDRFGAAIHHVTLKVPDLSEAVTILREGGLEPVDIRMDNPSWHEAFLRPSEVGGLVVQVAWAGQSVEQWARNIGHAPETPRPDAPALTGPLLRHPDLDIAAELWGLLGADITRTEDVLTLSWPKSPMTVRIESGAHAGPIALLGQGGSALPADPERGPELRIC